MLASHNNIVIILKEILKKMKCHADDICCTSYKIKLLLKCVLIILHEWMLGTISVTM